MLLSRLTFYKATFFVLLLSGCASLNNLKEIKDAKDIEKFSFNGRASISGEFVKNPGQGQISWKQNKKEINIVLSAPLGQGKIEINYIEGSSAKLAINKREEYFAETPDQLLQNVAGQNWPMTGLQNWVRGLPSYPARSRVTRDFTSNQIIKMEEDGWTIEYLEWETYRGYKLPKRLNIVRPSTKIKLFIESWSI